MIRVGQTRNLLRASSSLLEIWTRSAHHHPGQRRHVSRTNRPDKSTHSITCPKDQKFLANRAASTKEGSMGVPSPPGVVHAIGPGHGKVLIGGAALARGAKFRRLAILTVLSSLAQAGTAILLVGLLVFTLRLNVRDAADFTETWLAPLSAVAIALIGFVLVLRGLLALHRRRGRAKGDASHDHDHKACGCGHAHGPTVEEVHSLNSMREALAIVASIAIRPCTGALFVLVIAARFDAFGAGILAVLAMALGTAAITLTIAAGGRLARLFIAMGQSSGSAQALNLSAMLHIAGGGLILGLSLLFLAPYLT